MSDVSVVTPLWICGPWKGPYGYWVELKLTRPAWGTFVPECRDWVSANVEAQWLPGCSAGCWGRVISSPVCVCEQQWAAQPWASCVRAVLARETCCGPVKRKDNVACLSTDAQRVDSGEDWVSRCRVLTGWRPGVDWWLRCGQSEPSSVAGSICLVQGCAPMRSAGIVYSLMVDDQLVAKKKLLGMFCMS